MFTTLAAETLLSLAEAAALIPGNPAPSTVARWAIHGVRGVRLESFVVGGKRRTSREAIDRFLAALNADALAG